MKTLLPWGLLLAGSLRALAAHGQGFANNGFEAWTTRFGANAPVGWQSFDDLLAGQSGGTLPFATNSVTRTTAARSGAAALELRNTALPGIGTLPGLLALGNLFGSTNQNFWGGVPFTGRPARLEFYYKLAGTQAVADSAVVEVLLTSTGSGGRLQPVAAGSYLFRSLAANYTLASVPLVYQSGSRPDSVRIIILNSTASTPSASTVLTLDDFNFTGTATATRDAALNAALSIAPNPSPDGRFRLLADEAALLAAPLTVLDATGRVVLHEAVPAVAATSRVLDLGALPGGIYTVQLVTPRGLLTRKLVR